MSSPMPSSSTQGACSSSYSFSDYAEGFAQYVMRLVQTLRSVVEAAAHSAGNCARLTGEMLRSAENTALTILKKLGRPIQNEENIAVPSPQAAAAVQISEQNNAGTDVNSPALKISRPRPRITNWERGVLIGKGSFASVYKGYSNEDEISFAAKGVSLAEPNHLENEIAILKGLDHENILQCYGTQKDGEMLYIFLELVENGTLEKAYKNCRFDESQVSDYTRQILQGLRYLHSCKVVHGDLKCANILLTESGRIKIADFGVSNHSNGFLSDIRSLGGIVLEMSTGEYPQSNAQNVLISKEFAISCGKGLIVPDYLSHNLKDFIRKCLETDLTAAELLAHPFVKESSFHADS